MPLLKEWKFINAFGSLQEPIINEGNEFQQTRLFGKVYNDSRKDAITSEFEDGHRIITSPIVEINWSQRYIKTRSGTRYDIKGNPDEEYIEWLKSEDLWDKYNVNLLPVPEELN